jgi:DegV family protein with EDD domain
MAIKITADRMIDLSDKELESLNISTMSCYISMGGKSYEDLIDVFPDDIFAHLRKTGEVSKTAAKSPDAYYDFFKPFVDRGDSVIHFSAASGISAISHYSDIAASRLKGVYTIDTKTLSNGIALLAKYAIAQIEKGETDPEKIVALCKEQRKKLQGSFLLDTLECLYKGGRCSGFQMFGANLFKIKPVITLSDTGHMVTREKCRGNLPRAVAQYIKNSFEKFPNPDLKNLYIAHCVKDESLREHFINTVKLYHNFENIHWNDCSCNCAVHCGPNVFGFFYFMK